MVTVEPASAVPVSCGRGSLVLLPLPSVPVPGATSSVRLTIAGAPGATVSTTKVTAVDAGLVLPAASVAVVVMAWLPSDRLVDGVKLHFPVASAVAVPIGFPLS